MCPHTSSPNAALAGLVDLGPFTVNRLGYGAMRITGPGIWGEPRDPAEARRVLRPRREGSRRQPHRPAHSYGPEVSERLIAEALHPYPDDLVIATKSGLERGGPDTWWADGRAGGAAPRLRAQPRAAAPGAHRRVPAARRRFHGPVRGVPRDAGQPAARGQDPGDRRLQRHRGPARAGSGPDDDRLGAEPLQRRRPRLRRRAGDLRARGPRLHPLVPARRRQAGAGRFVQRGRGR